MFVLEALPARHGDALWLSWGTPDAPRHLLVDGGPASAATRAELESRIDGTRVELVVVTHIDADHITGVLGLLERRTLALQVGEVWFNGWDQLPTDVLGAKQGERLGAAIVHRRLGWNTGFGGGAVAVSDDGPLPVRQLPGGLKLTMLGPSQADLAALRPVWKEEVEKAGLVPGRAAEEERSRASDLLGDGPLEPELLAAETFADDQSVPNRASIAFLAEFEGRSLLLTGDAHTEGLVRGLRRLAQDRRIDRVPVDVVKVPHHGSRNNVGPELLSAVAAERYVFSTDGGIYHHPDPVAVARIITACSTTAQARGRPTEMAFTTRTDITSRWESPRLQRRYHYALRYPDRMGDPLRVYV
jgi:hypothetical protein